MFMLQTKIRRNVFKEGRGDLEEASPRSFLIEAYSLSRNYISVRIIRAILYIVLYCIVFIYTLEKSERLHYM